MRNKVPVRQCLGCREHRPKRELLRVVRSPEGEVSLDFKGKKSGRGAYVCPEPACLARCRKTRALERMLGTSFPDELWRALEEQMSAETANFCDDANDSRRGG